MTIKKLLDAFAEATIYDLEQLRFQGMPSHTTTLPSYQFMLHRRHSDQDIQPRTNAAGVFISTEHQGTHIDAVCHVAENMKLFGNVELHREVESPAGFTHGGAEEIPALLGRGVLIDAGKHYEGNRIPELHTVTLEEFLQMIEDQGVEVKEGDTVLVRTGYGAMWDDPVGYNKAGGIGAEASQWLADQGVIAVGSDNSAWEVPTYFDEKYQTTLPAHMILLARYGIFIIEHMFLEELAEDQVKEFFFMGQSLKMKGATGAPMRPLAVTYQK